MLLSFATLTKHRFNEVRLGEPEFYALCSDRGITVLEEDVATSFYFYVLGREFIVLNKNLTGLAREFEMFHELCHAFLSARIEQPKVAFHGLLDTKEEKEADAFACIALIPQSAIDDHSFVADCCCGMAKWIFDKRRKIFDLYGL